MNKWTTRLHDKLRLNTYVIRINCQVLKLLSYHLAIQLQLEQKYSYIVLFSISKPQNGDQTEET